MERRRQTSIQSPPRDVNCEHRRAHQCTHRTRRRSNRHPRLLPGTGTRAEGHIPRSSVRGPRAVSRLNRCAGAASAGY
eukprot:739604-Prymnesium_polylepis.1